MVEAWDYLLYDNLGLLPSIDFVSSRLSHITTYATLGLFSYKSSLTVKLEN